MLQPPKLDMVKDIIKDIHHGLTSICMFLILENIKINFDLDKFNQIIDENSLTPNTLNI